MATTFFAYFHVQKQLFLSDSPLPRVLHACMIVVLLFSDDPSIYLIVFFFWSCMCLFSTVATICTISNDSMNLATIAFALPCVFALYILALSNFPMFRNLRI